MDEHLAPDSAEQSLASDPGVVDETSTEYVGRWNRLVSTTNWEKGRIILEWRCRLMEASAPPSAYSDEAWSRRVGHVSPQHVGRLRRVHEQFGEVHEQYPGLYWSHFQAALDWHDAEMWLEGAVRSGWSVAQMRATRWEAVGAPADKKPKPEDIIVAELDEDVDAPVDEHSDRDTVAESTSVVRDVQADEAPQADAPEAELRDDARLASEQTTVEPVRPFEDLPPLPEDLAEAFESLKLAILNHKLAGWKEVSREHVLAALGAGLRGFIC